MVNKALFSSDHSEWRTPPHIFKRYNDRYQFTLDAAASKENTLCSRFYDKEMDSLSQSWDDDRIWCNPPYGRDLCRWIEKAALCKAPVVCMLLPARTDTKWFHLWCYQRPRVQIDLIAGRLKFGDAKNSAPFPSMVVIFT